MSRTILPVMRLLLSGDLHLGRRSTRIPDHLVDGSTAAAWGRLVDTAVAHQVDAVLLSGDLIDQDNRYFEALGPLESGLRRLQAAGIRAVAVAGNHDHATLPALAATLPAGALTLLGVGGRWEQITLTSRHDGTRVHVLGWSFPARTVRESPLRSLPALIHDGVPTVGLLHGDLDVASSVYAPLASSELARVPVRAWVLGHIHAGAVRAEAPLVLYPGSPQPLDPGESGVHGAWLAELSGGDAVGLEFVPLASVQYDTLPVNLHECDGLEQARTRAVHALRDAAARIWRDGLQHLALRLRFEGRTVTHGRLDALATQLRDLDSLALEADLHDEGMRTAHSVSVTHVHDATTPDHDLDALAHGADAIGVLAQLRRDLGTGQLDALPDALREALRRIPAEVAAARVFADVADSVMPDDAIAPLVRLQVDALLDALLAQRTPDGPA